METTTNKVIYTAKTRTQGGRGNGVSRSSDGNLDIRLSTPGTHGTGTNPEQLFGAGWSACFEGALDIVARKSRLTLPEDTLIDAEIDLVSGKDGYFLGARLNVSLPGLDREIARQFIDQASQICVYSKAIHGNVNVEYNLV